MQGLKKILCAFIVGGCCGLVGQGLITLVSQFIPDVTVVTLVAMFLFGLVSVVLIITGAYAKIAKFGGDGAAIPLCGLMFGAAAARAGAQKAGASAGKAFGIGFVKIIAVLGIGFIISFVLGLFRLPSSGIAPAAVINPVLPFLFAMLIGGTICAIAQLLSEIKVPFPITAVVLVALGGILTPLGVMDFLGSLGAGGASVTAMGCGNGAYGAGLAACQGNWMVLGLVAALNIALIVMGSLSGGAMLKLHPECLPDPPTTE